jgi:hypothetical protein
MFRTAQFVIALRPDADPAAFAAHVRDVLFEDPTVMAPTRITRGFGHRLLEVVHGPEGLPPRYVWEVTADLMGNGNYDFRRNLGSVQERITTFGVLVDLIQTEDTQPPLAG